MIRIRTIQKQDFEQLTQIEFESFTDPYPKELFQFLAGTQPDQFLVAIEKKGETESILGYAVADIDRKLQSKVGHILSIAIGKKYRARPMSADKRGLFPEMGTKRRHNGTSSRPAKTQFTLQSIDAAIPGAEGATR